MPMSFIRSLCLGLSVFLCQCVFESAPGNPGPGKPEDTTGQVDTPTGCKSKPHGGAWQSLNRKVIRPLSLAFEGETIWIGTENSGLLKKESLEGPPVILPTEGDPD